MKIFLSEKMHGDDSSFYCSSMLSKSFRDLENNELCSILGASFEVLSSEISYFAEHVVGVLVVFDII